MAVAHVQKCALEFNLLSTECTRVPNAFTEFGLLQKGQSPTVAK